MRHFFYSLIFILGIAGNWASASEKLDLINKKIPLYDWSFDNGKEFKGATGELVIAEDVPVKRKPALELKGDFSGGGQYVQMATSLPDRDLDELSFWVKAPAGQQTLNFRLIDGSGQCHQIKLKIDPAGDWQEIKFPVKKFFSNKGGKEAVPELWQYEKWGGKEDGSWTNPGKTIAFLSGLKDYSGSKTGSMQISNVTVKVGAAKKWPGKEIKLDTDLRKKKLTWGFNDGREFPGAKGSVEISKDDPAGGKNSLKFEGDFTGGGSYVSIGKGLEDKDIEVITMKVKTDNVTSIGFRLIDSTKQCHQSKGIKIVPDGEWNLVVIPVEDVVGGEHWGGDNDGVWHGGAKSMNILLGTNSAKDKKPSILISDIRAHLKK